MSTICFIFARGGSKGLKNKNLLKFRETTLLGNAIKQAKNIKKIKKIFVSTDSKLIKKEALKYKAEVPFLRPKSLSSDRSPEILSWKHAIKYLKDKLNLNPEYIVSLPTTSPLRSIKDIQKCINLAKKKKLDLVVGVSKSSKNPFFNMLLKIKSGGSLVKFSSIFKKKYKQKKYFRRQDTPEVFNVTTACYVFKTKFIMSSKSLFTGKLGYITIPKERALDIDDSFDYKVLNLLSKK